ncbi:hypothetical protein PIB30_017730 [Stylosanthes scabra]|uniref:Uncharacterized protein n=1 Tax=Stylosanthes scabra TaxID=79078 RepID=A0ABU6S791_9FABA|nr:hypothetical protein [Stylosanthes scabra]
MTTNEFFYYILFPNGAIEDGVLFQSSSPVFFRSHPVSTVRELKELMLSNIRGDGLREIGNIGYRFQSQQPDKKFVNQVIWINEDENVRATFEVRKVRGPSAPSSALRSPSRE